MHSRFQSSLQSGLQSDYAKSTSSFFGNILTTTTSKYNTLKRQLISSEADGDTEDDSHIARGLRAYYTEKGRQFPEWLPPDPIAPPPPQSIQFVSSSSTNAAQQDYSGQSQQSGRWGRQGGGLSDLWGDNNRNSAPAAADSLRQRPGVSQSNSSSLAPTSLQGGRFGTSRLGAGRDSAQQEMQSRPLPSQRAGSYQNQRTSDWGRFDTASPPPLSGSTSAAGTAQDRLKARLWGAGRTASPPPSNEPTLSVANSRDLYENVGSPEGGTRPGSNPYLSQGGGNASYGSPRAVSQGRPIARANSPSSSGGENYGGERRYEQDSPRPGVGLPSDPRPGKHGVGLPSGPRSRRF